MNLISFGQEKSLETIDSLKAEKLFEGTISEDSSGNFVITRLKFEPPTRLISLTKAPAPLGEIMEEISKLPRGPITQFSPYLEIKVLIEQPEPALRHTIEEALKEKDVRLTRIEAVTKQHKKEQSSITFEQLKTISPLEIAQDIFGKKYGGNAMPLEMKELFIKAIEEAKK